MKLHEIIVTILYAGIVSWMTYDMGAPNWAILMIFVILLNLISLRFEFSRDK